MKKILIAGGQCGITMLRASEIIKDKAIMTGFDVNIKIHDLWMSSAVDVDCDLIIEMFPYFDEVTCPLLDGRPFINRIREKELVDKVMELLGEC